MNNVQLKNLVKEKDLGVIVSTKDHIQKDIQPNVKVWMTVDGGAI